MQDISQTFPHGAMGDGAEGLGCLTEHPTGRAESRRDAEGGGDGTSEGGSAEKDHVHQLLMCT